MTPIDFCFLLAFCFQELTAEISELQQKKDNLEAELKKVLAIFFMKKLLVFYYNNFFDITDSTDFGTSCV